MIFMTESHDELVKKICQDIFVPMLKENLDKDQKEVDHASHEDGQEESYDLRIAYNNIYSRVLKNIHYYHANIRSLKSVFKKNQDVKAQLKTLINSSMASIAYDFVNKSNAYNVSNIQVRNETLSYYIEPRQKPRYQAFCKAINYLHDHELRAIRNDDCLVVEKKYGQANTGLELVVNFDVHDKPFRIIFQPVGNVPFGDMAQMDCPPYVDNKTSADFISYALPVIKKMFKEKFDVKLNGSEDD